MRLSHFFEQSAFASSGIAVLHVLAVVLFVAVLLSWGRHARRWWFVVSGCTFVSLITVVYFATVHPGDIPVDWITILTHGLERKTLMHLYTLGVNAGASFRIVVSAAASGPVPTLHDVVWLNLWLALVNAVLFFHVALYVTGRVWALVWTALFALNPMMFLAAFSELPTNVLVLYFLIAVLAWAVVNDPLPQPRLIRAAAYALCAILTLLTAFTRLELAVIGAIALGLHGAYALLGSSRWSAVAHRLRVVGEPLLAFLEAHLAVVGVLCVVGLVLARSGLPGGVGRDEVAGVYPFNPSFFGLFSFLPMMVLPIGLSVATFFGFLHGLFNFWRFGGLPLSLFMVVRAYFAGENSYYAMARYMTYLLPAVFLLGLFGTRTFYDMVRRYLRPSWYRVARIAYVMAWFTPPLPGIVEFYLRPEYHSGAIVSQLLLDLNTQREVRYLVALMQNNPQCVFVGRVVQDRGNFRVSPEYAYFVFGRPLAQPVVVPEKEASLDEVIARAVPDTSCVRLYYGGDCNVTFGDRCQSFIAGRTLIDQTRFWSRPYNTNPFDYGDGYPEIVLATYAWP